MSRVWCKFDHYAITRVGCSAWGTFPIVRYIFSGFPSALGTAAAMSRCKIEGVYAVRTSWKSGYYGRWCFMMVVVDSKRSIFGCR